MKKNILIISLALHVIVPFFSLGFLHPDEQYYVLDFAFSKLGILEELKSWEFDAQIRPWFLPSIFFVLGSFLKINNPFTLSLIFRLLSSLFAYFSHLTFMNSLEKAYPKLVPKNLTWVLFLPWPVILMHSRTNSENWSTSFFLLAVSLLLKKKNFIFSGILLSFTFFTRFQFGFLMLPLIFLMKKKIIPVALGFLVTTLFMVGIDYWGHGEWVFTPFNYLKINLIDGKVNTFGTSSPFYYIYKTITKLLPVWGITLVTVFILSFKKIKEDKLIRDILLLVSLFLIVHHSIGHKELRFIYPVLPFVLILVAKSLDHWRKRQQFLFKFLNYLAIPILFIPAYKPMRVYQYAYNNADQLKSVSHFHFQNPLEITSLLSKKMKYPPYEPGNSFILTQNFKQLQRLPLERCRPLVSTYPYFLIRLNPGNILANSNIWTIMDCSPK